MPFEQMKAKVNRRLWMCFLFGLAIMLILSLILGIKVSPVFSIVLAILYICGLGYMLFRLKNTHDELVQKSVFNLALYLKNENNRIFHKHKVTARPGFLGKWIEIHFRTETSSLREVEF